MPYKTIDDAIQLSKMGKGSLVSSIVTADDKIAHMYVIGALVCMENFSSDAERERKHRTWFSNANVGAWWARAVQVVGRNGWQTWCVSLFVAHCDTRISHNN